MSDRLTTELITLYNFYKSWERPPDLVETIRWFLMEVEGIDPDKPEINTLEDQFYECKRKLPGSHTTSPK